MTSITVKSTDKTQFTLSLPSGATVGTLLNKVSETKKCPIESFNIIFNGTILNNENDKLSDKKIVNNSTVIFFKKNVKTPVPQKNDCLKTNIVEPKPVVVKEKEKDDMDVDDSSSDIDRDDNMDGDNNNPYNIFPVPNMGNVQHMIGNMEDLQHIIGNMLQHAQNNHGGNFDFLQDFDLDLDQEGPFQDNQNGDNNLDQVVVQPNPNRRRGNNLFQALNIPQGVLQNNQGPLPGFAGRRVDLLQALSQEDQQAIRDIQNILTHVSIPVILQYYEACEKNIENTINAILTDPNANQNLGEFF